MDVENKDKQDVRPSVESQLKLLVIPGNTIEELKVQILNWIECANEQHNKPLSLGEINRRFHALAKPYGKVNDIMAELVKERRVLLVRSTRNTTMVITMAFYELLIGDSPFGLERFMEHYNESRAGLNK